MDNTIVVAETTEVTKAREMGATTIQRATELARNITDAKTLAEAADFMLEIKRRRKQWAEFNKPAKQKLDILKKELLDRERQIDEPLERAENQIIKPAMARFQQEDERRRREEEDRLRAEAKKKEEDARLREADMLAKDGHTELADAMLDAPVVVAPIVVPRTETPAGISYRDSWQFEILNPDAVPRQYLTIDEKKIGGVVRALKGETRIDGVRVWCEKTIAGRV